MVMMTERTKRTKMEKTRLERTSVVELGSVEHAFGPQRRCAHVLDWKAGTVQSGGRKVGCWTFLGESEKWMGGSSKA